MWWSSSSYKWLLTLQSKFSFISTDAQTNVLVKVFSLGTAFGDQTCSCCLSSMIWFQLLSKTLWKSSSPSTSSSLKMCFHHLSILCLIHVTRYQFLACVPLNSLKQSMVRLPEAYFLSLPIFLQIFPFTICHSFTPRRFTTVEDNLSPTDRQTDNPSV